MLLNKIQFEEPASKKVRVAEAKTQWVSAEAWLLAVALAVFGLNAFFGK